MATSSRDTQKRSARGTIIETSGEIFTDGSVLELLASETDPILQLLLWQKKNKTVGSQIEYRGHSYRPPEIDASLFAAMRLPSDASDYGSTAKLFSELQALFTLYVGVAPDEAALLTTWSVSSWFQECFSSPPTLLVTGADTCHAITLLRIFKCICRRGLLLAEISRSSLLDVAFLRPTLLMNQPAPASKVWPLLEASNHQDLSLIGKGRAHQVAGCKAIYVGTENARLEGAFYFALRPARVQLPILDSERQTEIASRFQPLLLEYRLRNVKAVREFGRTVYPQYPATAGALIVCSQEEPNIERAILPLLRRQNQEEQFHNHCDVTRAVVEVTWSPLHDQMDLPISKIAELVNTLIRSRGEALIYSPVEIGYRLKNLGFQRHRIAGGMILRPSRENQIVSHNLARHFDLKLAPVAGCSDCSVTIGQTEVGRV